MPVQVIEGKIIKQCKQNDRDGYNALFKKYEGYIYTICYHYTNSKEDALDLVQEVFIRIYKGMAKFEEGKPLLPWIKRITVNTCLNYVRSNKIATVSLNQSANQEGNAIENMVADSTDVEKTVILALTRSVLDETIATLPPEMKLAIILRHIDGMSYEEIGNAMSAPIGTIKTYLYRGRSILKAKLQQYDVWEV